MHNNYYFLRQLSARLKNVLTDFTLVSCFSQNREELVLEFNNTQKSFFIKANLQSAFSCLSFPESFNRARKNSVDLFNEALMKKVKDIHQFENERSFAIEFENDLKLVFKMHGNRSNIILFEENKVREIFINRHQSDYGLNLSALDRTIDWSKNAFLSHVTDLNNHYFTFGKVVWNYLSEKGFYQLDTESKWAVVQQTIHDLSQPTFYIINKDDKIIFSLLPFKGIVKTIEDPIDAINEFFQIFSANYFFHSEKNADLSRINDRLKASENFVKKNQQKLIELENDHHYQAWADLIMANLHRIKTGDDNVEVENFYNNNQKEIIKLRKDLSAQKNAELYYRKGKNQHIEIQKLKESIEKKEKEILNQKNSLEQIKLSDNLKDLRKKSATSEHLIKANNKLVHLPYHEFEFKGFKIWVGKNAESNDKLTLHHSYKEDLWLHAKDTPGSHVILKYQAGKNFPKDVIERAAELAAYNSKRKTETLCPVIFTPKKFVRKRKGDPAGMVVVEKEEVILVEPKLYL